MSNKDNFFYGYKCFNKGLTNRYGIKYEVGKEYHCDKEIKFGNNGHGFHVCKRLEDTLKFFDKDIDIAYVKCYGTYDKIKENKENDYNDNYDMYAFEYMVIEKILTREDIILYALNLNEERIKKFLMYFKLTSAEKNIFKEKFKNCQYMLNFIAYYQEDDKEAFTHHEKRLLKKKTL